MFNKVVNEQIVLKQLMEKDAESLFALVDGSRHHLAEWLPWVGKNTKVEDSYAFIKMTLEQYQSNNVITAGIWYEGKLIGVIGYHGIDHSNKSTSIGYWIGKDYQGKGIITKSCRGMIEYGFSELMLHRIEIRCAIKNYQSRQIPERLGFRKEGVIRDAELINGEYVSHVIYGLLSNEI